MNVYQEAILAQICLAAEAALLARDNRMYPAKQVNYVQKQQAQADEGALDELRGVGLAGLRDVLCGKLYGFLPPRINTAAMQEAIVDHLSRLLDQGAGFPHCSFPQSLFTAVAGTLIRDKHNALNAFTVWFDEQLGDVLQVFETTAAGIVSDEGAVVGAGGYVDTLTSFKRWQFRLHNVSEHPVQGDELDDFDSMSITPSASESKRSHERTADPSRKKQRLLVSS
ncbi:hypothetical protein FB451DRAFT_1225124 [Mycena latifolia]|nr:hypothetical protein FB451DRAFT_1225124 [Mycena latifolia]